ncbi:uncharacterized protein LOC120698939 isoform X8 [Panicum virgatum]|uniref:uncharacterized protein LOC120698939 isoform X8 n=1 Tax=Panicum virgatum TaxID=38727 RepID=UPI0019D68F97|nr:uncharacterized protein LOC120698939 isoform X8 [Panicum virgatum]
MKRRLDPVHRHEQPESGGESVGIADQMHQGLASNLVVQAQNQIEGTVRTRGNESVPSLCSLAAAAIPGVHSEDLIRTPTSSIAGRGVVRKGSK